MSEYKMPSLGADMEDAVLVEWKVKKGDQVRKGDIIAEIETVKGAIDVEVFEDGIVEKIMAKPGQKLPVGAVLAFINTDSVKLHIAVDPEEEKPKEKPMEIPPVKDPPESIPPIEIPPIGDPKRDPIPPEIVPTTDPVRQPPPPEVPFSKNKINGSTRIKASPLAKRIASDLGIDLQVISSSHDSGVIHKIDVENYVKTQRKIQETIPGKSEVASTISAQIPATSKKEKMRSAIAAAMSRSNREIPHYYLETSIDMKKALEWLENENQKRKVKERLLSVVLLLKATALALVEVPALNAYWTEDGHQIQEAINIGFTISLRQGGLVIPAIQQVDQKSLGVIMEEVTDVIQRARTAKLRSSELTEGTITITNVGERGAEKVFGIIYPPQVALIGFGKIIEKPWAVDEMLAIHPVLTVTLAGDHRATDGMTGSRFLEKLNLLLQNPQQL